MSNRNRPPVKIISGSFSYCCKASRSWIAMGYRMVKSKRWGDGKFTFILEKVI